MTRRKRHRLGQHFLVDPGVAERIVRLLSDEPSQVVEIGPGRGALTAPLLERFGRVLAIEVDSELTVGLERRFSGTPLEVCRADALREPLDPMLADRVPWQLASNLPYSVGTAILRRLLPRRDLFTRLVVMLQREVVERIVAEPGGSGHGLLALERAAFADATVAFHVSPNVFRPRPRVESSVVVLDLRPPPFDAELLEQAFALAARTLTKPRKMLANAMGKLATAEQIEAAGLDPKARPGTVALEEWVQLAQACTFEPR